MVESLSLHVPAFLWRARPPGDGAAALLHLLVRLAALRGRPLFLWLLRDAGGRLAGGRLLARDHLLHEGEGIFLLDEVFALRFGAVGLPRGPGGNDTPTHIPCGIAARVCLEDKKLAPPRWGREWERRSG